MCPSPSAWHQPLNLPALQRYRNNIIKDLVKLKYFINIEILSKNFINKEFIKEYKLINIKLINIKLINIKLIKLFKLYLVNNKKILNIIYIILIRFKLNNYISKV